MVLSILPVFLKKKIKNPDTAIVFFLSNNFVKKVEFSKRWAKSFVAGLIVLFNRLNSRFCV